MTDLDANKEAITSGLAALTSIGGKQNICLRLSGSLVSGNTKTSEELQAFNSVLAGHGIRAERVELGGVWVTEFSTVKEATRDNPL